MTLAPPSNEIDLPSTEEIREDVKRSLLLYSRSCDPRYQPERMHKFIARKLQGAVAGKSRRLIFNTPPQHGKSRLVSVEFPCWYLGINPRNRVVLSSYGQDLSNRASRAARSRVQSQEHRYLFPENVPNRANWSVNEWAVTLGGGCRSVGVGGGITGHPADLVIVDDAHKNHQEAHSLVQRDDVWNWFLADIMTRLSPTAIIIIIMTRWHVDDLCGRLQDPARIAQLKDMGFEDEIYEHYNLPAIAGEKDHLGRKEGEALWPERYSERWLRAQMTILGSYKSGAMYQGEPVLKGGNYVNVANFTVIKRQNLPEGLTDWKRFWDLGATKKDDTKKSDPDSTCGVKGALRKWSEVVDGKTVQFEELYLADMHAGQWAWPVSREKIKTIAIAESIIVGLEVVAGFKTAYANLREVLPETIMLREIGVNKDKLTRALPWIALTEKKRVFLVEGDWVAPFMLQAEQFPNGAHDDGVDAVSGVYEMLHTGRLVWA